MANAHAAFHFATETLKWPKDAQRPDMDMA
jgi:hypothetical protein